MAFTFPWTERRQTPEEIMRETLPSEEELGRRYMEAGGGMGVSGYRGNGVGTEAGRGFESQEEASRYLSWRARAGVPASAPDTPEMLERFRTGPARAPATGIEAMLALERGGQRITGTAVGPEGYAIGTLPVRGIGPGYAGALRPGEVSEYGGMGGGTETGRMRERVGAMSEAAGGGVPAGMAQGRQFDPTTGAFRDISIAQQLAAAGLAGTPTPSGIMTNVPTGIMTESDWARKRMGGGLRQMQPVSERQAFERKTTIEQSEAARAADRASREKLALAKIQFSPSGKTYAQGGGVFPSPVAATVGPGEGAILSADKKFFRSPGDTTWKPVPRERIEARRVGAIRPADLKKYTARRTGIKQELAALQEEDAKYKGEYRGPDWLPGDRKSYSKQINALIAEQASIDAVLGPEEEDFADEAEARAAGHVTGEVVMVRGRKYRLN